MKVTSTGFQFSRLAELKEFIQEMDLMGVVSLADPVVDNSGNVLIKEGVPIRPAAIERLEQMEGQYKQEFIIRVDPGLRKRLIAFIVPQIEERIKKSKREFIPYLIEAAGRRYRGFIETAIQKEILVLSLYKLLRKDPKFFERIVDLGLLCLGIALNAQIRERFMHRFAFQSGLLSDFALAGSQELLDEPGMPYAKRQKINLRCAEFAVDYGAGAEVQEAIRSHAINLNQPGFKEFKLPGGEANDADDFDFVPKDILAEEEEELSETESQASGAILTEILRLGRYILETSALVKDEEHGTEELVYMIAYNSARGYFHPELSRTVVELFRQYEKGVKRMQKIAEVERACIHPPSAWAYPKPRATQVVCKNHKEECPKIIRGWDINIVSPAEAYGWVGETLPAGNYFKCALQSELEKLD